MLMALVRGKLVDEERETGKGPGGGWNEKMGGPIEEGEKT